MYYFLENKDRMLAKFYWIQQDPRLLRYVVVTTVLAAVAVTSVGIPIMFSG
jgi:hypothetical protein